jgi:tetratricopeptide (TPR) repeat protein
MSVILDDRNRYRESPFFENISKLVIHQKNEILKKAIFYFLSKKYNEAQDYLLATYPEFSLNEDSNALLLMGHIQLKLHQLDSAIEYFRQSLK